MSNETFPTIEIDGYWSRDNQWLVMCADRGGVHWVGLHETKASAVEAVRDLVAARAGPDTIEGPLDAAWVTKCPFFVGEE